MSRALALAVALLGAAVASSPAQQESGKKKYAVLVGVNLYQNKHDALKPLKFAEADVLELKSVLESQDYEVITLTSATSQDDESLRPLRANIDAQLDRLFGKKDPATKRTEGGRIQPGDTVLIGLSGHGLRFANDSNNYFCPADAIPLPTQTGTLIALESIVERLQASSAGARMLLVDACRNEVKGAAKGAGSSLDIAAGIHVLLSCQAHEQSYEDGQLKHGVFFYHVLEALKGRNREVGEPVTWDDVSKHVRTHVASVAKVHGDQNPIDLSRGTIRSPVMAVPTRPQLAVAPFSKETAEERQKSWARFTRGRSDITEDIRFGTSENPVVLKVVLIPPGEFTMGAPKEEGNGDEYTEHVHRVTLTKPFYMGRSEVTQKQFRALFPSHRNAFSAVGGMKERVQGLNTDEFPADSISREAAMQFCDKLNRLLADDARWDGYECRLPTEAEWEYACRAGTVTPFNFGSRCDQRANCRLTNKKAIECVPREVGFSLNAFGLTDMHGNVHEWCLDTFAPYPQRAVSDPKPATGGVTYVQRGGGYASSESASRSAARNEVEPGEVTPGNGFRIVIAPKR